MEKQLTVLHSDKRVSLWQEIRKGDKEALFELYDDLYFHLVRFGLSVHCDHELVKDCISQLFLKLWDRHGRLNEVENVKSYLFTSLKRLISDHIHSDQKVLSSLQQLEEEKELSYEEMIVSLEKDKEVKMRLAAALKSLSPRQIELIRLKFFENRSYKEIADLSSLSIKTSYNTIYDAIKTLRLKLKV